MNSISGPTKTRGQRQLNFTSNTIYFNKKKCQFSSYISSRDIKVFNFSCNFCSKGEIYLLKIIKSLPVVKFVKICYSNFNFLTSNLILNRTLTFAYRLQY